MIKHLFKIGFLGAVVLSVMSCSNDDTLKEQNIDEESGVISNSEMTLTYGSGLLGKYVSTKNSKITFDRLSVTNAPKKISSTNNYQQPDLTNAIQLSGSGWQNLADNTTYYIAEGTTFSGGINFTGNNSTLVVLGTIGGNNWFEIKNNAQVIIAPTAQLLSTTSFTVENSIVDNYGDILSANFNLNGGGVLNNYGSITEFQSGNNSELNNYGTASSSKAGIDGTINNSNSLVFTQQTTLNNSGIINNDCELIFNEHININADITNNGYADFQNGFLINASGNLIVGAGSLTDITGGQISISGKFKNTSAGVARLDIVNAAIGWLNAAPSFEGKIDINTNLTIDNNKIDSYVTFNGDTYIASNGCMPQRGSSACDDSALQFTLAATVQSPSVNGAVLSATGVKVTDGQAYVSYHTNDEVYGDAPNGSLRIFNVQNQQAPLLLAQADFNNAEFNGIDVDNNTVYAVGGNKAGARLITTPLIDGMFDTTDLSVFESHKLSGIAAKNVFMYNNMLWLVAGGSNGGFLKLNPSDNYTVSESFYTQGSRAKYAAQNGTYQAFFAVESNGAYLRIANIDGSNPQVYNYAQLTQSVQTGKNVITMDDEYVYVALSEKGVAKIDLATGALISHFVPNDYRLTENGPKVFRENGYTNGVAVNDCYLYLANGADGIIVLNKNTFNVVGSFKLAESANYIYTKDGLMFVATGRDGLNIITIN